MTQWIFMNGEFVRKEDAKVSVYDHGFLYGDGVFEGIRAYSGNVYRLKEHLTRLYESAKAVLLDIPYSLPEVESFIVETLRRNALENAYIRVVVSRGTGDLGLDPFACRQPQLIVIAEQLTLFPKELYEHGMEIVTVATRRNRSDILDPKIKSLNYLNNILIKIEANLAGVREALTLNTEGYVAEGSGDNVFIVKNGRILTPPSSAGALEGITRNAILEIARTVGYEAEERLFTRHDVYVADEVFLTGTAAEIIPVVKVDGRAIAEGKPGPHTKRLLEAFRSQVVELGTKIHPER